MSYLAVAIVTMIGCGVYFGSFFYADALTRSAQEFYRDTNFADLDVIAIRGISPDEIKEIASIDGIQDAEGTFQSSSLQEGHRLRVCALSREGSRQRSDLVG